MLVEASDLFTPADIEFAARKGSQRALGLAIYGELDTQPRVGGPKRKIARGGLTPYSSARSGLTSGSTTCRSSELLLVLHAGQGFPQSSGQHPAVELAQEPDVLGLQRHDAPEVRQSRVS